MATTQAMTLASTEVRAIAKDAYIYGFPLVDNYRVMHSYFVDRAGKEFKAPWNRIHNEARVYTPDDRTIQTPNSHTPYSQLGTDLRAEPLVVTVPAVERGRYYSLQFIDLYTFNYAYVGSRGTGADAAHFLLAGPRSTGEKPDAVKAVIRSETSWAGSSSARNSLTRTTSKASRKYRPATRCNRFRFLLVRPRRRLRLRSISSSRSIRNSSARRPSSSTF